MMKKLALVSPLRRRLLFGLALAPWLGACQTMQGKGADPLPSWRDTKTKQTILDFVATVTAAQGQGYVAPADRLAVFDNDGTLWSEQPLYFQFVFLLEQVKAAAPKHPEWKNNPAFRALMANDRQALAKLGQKPVLELVAAANSGMSTRAYDETIREWLVTARHPRFDRLYTELVYQPMRELLDYLGANGFKNFLVSGGSIEFMRPWVQQAYGVPPEQVIGTVSQVEFGIKDNEPVLTRLPRIEFLDDGPGKPVGIYRGIGRQPIAAFGNSDGDLQMLQWTAGARGARLIGLVHHTDQAREWAYDRDSHIGRLDKALDEANQRGWTVIDMQRDWAKVYAFD